MGEWKTVRVGDLAAPGSNAMATGPFGSAISSRYFRTTGVPVIRGGNLSTDSGARLNDKAGLVFLEPLKADEFSRSKVRRGDLIFTCWGTINQIGLIDASARYPEYVLSNKQMKLTPDPHLADSEFLYYLFSSPELQSEIVGGSIGSSIPGFNLTRLRALEIEIPPLEEQKRIARALSDAERSEMRIKEAIVKRRALKEGVLQQLVTGNSRLPGFVQEWKSNVSLHQVTTRFAGYWGAAPGIRGVDVSIVRAGDVSAENSLTGFARRSVTPAEFARSRCLRGDVILTTSGTIGNVAFVETDSLVASNFVRVLRPSIALRGPFLYYLLQSPVAKAAMTRHTGLSAMPNLGAGFFREPFIALPTPGEQDAISSVLVDLDSEIALLDRRRAKARAIKVGMMQQLLTGRTRLPVKEAAS